MEFVTINIIHGDDEIALRFSKYDTVGDLKNKIFEHFHIPPSLQIIDCWLKEPADDFFILETCCDVETENYLVVNNSDDLERNGLYSVENASVYQEADGPKLEEKMEELEQCAAISFVEYFSNNFDDLGVSFHMCRLEDAIQAGCFPNSEKRKALLLYLHNKSDRFAKIFCENLAKPEVKHIINEHIFLMGWDVETTKYQPALIQALNFRNELSNLINFIEKKVCAALIIVPVNDSITLFSCMRGKVSDKNFLETLKRSQEFLENENKIEEDIADSQQQSSTDFGSINYQQLMLNMLGDRDYDSFDFFEFAQLKDKIGYALYGPPQQEEGYNEKERKRIDTLAEVIVKENNAFSKWKDRVVISFIYNCIEPLPKEKQKRLKKIDDYNPNTDLIPLPLFILRKCKHSDNPCRIVIDDNGRVYKSWTDYMTRNKLHECEMILPRNGRYLADKNGKVLLERHLSPACGIDRKILQGADMANTAAGLLSGGVFLAAAIPAIAVAPVALVAAGATGIGVGIYSMARSASTLYDRNRHKETLSMANSEARGAYLNIVAGSLGFVGAGANMAISQLASRGVNIGQGASAAVNVINVANLGASGISVANSSYDVFNQWWNENQTPSLLAIVQLSSSVLFFGHALYNFRTVDTVIEESQTNSLREYNDSLRSNRHRKMFNKMLKETIRQNNGDIKLGQAEVIKTMRNIQTQKDDVFAALTRSNKLMNQEDIKFSADNGVIKLNGVPIDVSKFTSLDKTEVITFLTQLPATREPTLSDVRVMDSRLKISFRNFNTGDLTNLAFGLIRMFGSTDMTIQEKIINAVSSILSQLRVEPGCLTQLDAIFPSHQKFFRLFGMVNTFFQKLVDQVEEQFIKWLATKEPSFEKPVFVELSLDSAKRAVELFNFVSKAYYVGTNLTEAGLNELIKYFYTWLAKQMLTYDEQQTRKKRRLVHSASPARQLKCPDCNGVYFR